MCARKMVLVCVCVCLIPDSDENIEAGMFHAPVLTQITQRGTNQLLYDETIRSFPISYIFFPHMFESF